MLQEISNLINVVKDFPKPGIFFRDVSPLLLNPKLYNSAIARMTTLLKDLKIDYVLGLESRGFIFGISVAQALNVGFIMARKPNKMPNNIEVTYEKEYGVDTLTIQNNLVPVNSNVLIVDDLIATGASVVACTDLVEKIGCRVSGILCLIELTGISKHEKISKYNLQTLLRFPVHSDTKVYSDTKIVPTESDIMPFYDNIPEQYYPGDVQPKQFINVYVATKNPTKLSATYNAIRSFFDSTGKEDHHLTVFGVNVPSDVPEQPINEETKIGCHNRLLHLQQYVEYHKCKFDILVSIENGIRCDPDTLNPDSVVTDFCCVEIFICGEYKSLPTEYETPFPAKYLIESIKTNQTLTVGKIIEKEFGYEPGTWHEHFGSKISRYEIIQMEVFTVVAFAMCGPDDENED